MLTLSRSDRCLFPGATGEAAAPASVSGVCFWPLQRSDWNFSLRSSSSGVRKTNFISGCSCSRPKPPDFPAGLTGSGCWCGWLSG